MPTPYPPEFRRDVIAVARRGDQSREQVARSMGTPRPAWPAGCESPTAQTSSPGVQLGAEGAQLLKRGCGLGSFLTAGSS